MAVKPILFNHDSMFGLIYGNKCVTRRIIKPPSNIQQINDIPLWGKGEKIRQTYGIPIYWFDVIQDNGRQKPFKTCVGFRCPYNVGDVLWVRETFRIIDGVTFFKCGCSKKSKKLIQEEGGWKASIHMPYTSARYFLKVTKVYPQRIQDVTIEDIQKEGFQISDSLNHPFYNDTDIKQQVETGLKNDFIIKWDRTVSKDKKNLYSWDSNPWVWVIEFKDVSDEYSKNRREKQG